MRIKVMLVVVCFNSNPVSLPVAGDRYLDECKSCVEQRPGFSKDQKGRMLLSDETRNGPHITCTFTTL